MPPRSVPHGEAPRLEGHFARLEPAGSRYQPGEKPELLELVDHDVILRLTPEEDPRPRGQGGRRQDDEKANEHADGM